MADSIAVGLIGCGVIAEHAHIPSLERHPLAKLVAVADKDPDRRAWTGKRLPGTKLAADGMELLDDPAVEAVLIALPTARTAEMAAAAFAAGKHVYVEKPGAQSAGEWQAVVDAWSRSGKTGAIGYNFRHNPIFVDAVRRVRDSALGTVIGLQTRFTWAAGHLKGWRAARSEGGGVLLDLACHHVDLATTLLDDSVRAVRCVARSLYTEEDTAELTLAFQGDASAQILVSYASGANENRLTVVGSEGVLDVDLLDARPRRIRKRPGRLERFRRSWQALDELHPVRLLRAPGREPSFAAALGAFLDGVKRKQSVRPDPRDGQRVLRAIDAAGISAGNGGATVEVADDAGR